MQECDGCPTVVSDGERGRLVGLRAPTRIQEQVGRLRTHRRQRDRPRGEQGVVRAGGVRKIIPFIRVRDGHGPRPLVNAERD